MKQGVSREHGLLVAVLHVPTNAVLGVAGGVKALDGDAAQLEALAIVGRLRHTIAFLTADHGQVGFAQLRQLVGVLVCLPFYLLAGKTEVWLTICLLPPAWSQWLSRRLDIGHTG